MSIEFLITSLIVIVSPGTGVLYTLAAGLSRGARASVVAAFGCTIGIVPHMAAAIMGLAALLHTSVLAFQIFKYVGVAYLLYMAWSTLRERGAMRVEKEPDARSALQIAVTGVLINILNPKLSIFFLAFLPQFVSAEESHPLALMLALSAVFMLMTSSRLSATDCSPPRSATTSYRGRGCWRGCGGFLPARLPRSARGLR